jgi:hypothetical protein
LKAFNPSLFVPPTAKLAGNFSMDLSNPQAVPQFDQQATDRVCVRWESNPLPEAGNTLDVVMFINASVATKTLYGSSWRRKPYATTTVGLQKP